ncbi:hypothetical protein E4U24_002003 [Claviceps purpurea]|nr:hypothetical protein E4U24_002003 [Claviceps purpurea]
MATPPQGVGNSADLHTPVNATQGARDFLVDDGYQFDFDHIHGLTPAAFGTRLAWRSRACGGRRSSQLPAAASPSRAGDGGCPRF